MQNTAQPGTFVAATAAQPVYKKLSELEAIATAHASGSKQVFTKGRTDLTRITQIAFGILLQLENIPAHSHADMDECFFFTAGSGTMTIDEKIYELTEGIYITVPATALHSLTCSGETLKFFYFGLQVYNLPPAE